MYLVIHMPQKYNYRAIMTSNREKIYFHYLLTNPMFIKNVPAHYFKNKEIRFVYELVKKEFERSEKKIVASIPEMYDMIKSADTENKYSDDLIKSILKMDLTKYRMDEYIKPRFTSWVLKNKTSDGIIEAVDKMRNMDEDDDDPEVMMESLNAIRNTLDTATKPDYSDITIGADFDNPEDHYQDTYYNKIPTGWETLNGLLGGGLDRKTLNVLMAQTNGGKSLWMQNFAMYAANKGYNVVYISLEMSEKKVMKRLGAMRLRIPIKDYDEVSKDREYMKDRISRLQQMQSDRSDLFNESLGKIYVKEFPTGTLDTVELEAYLKRVEEVSGKKVDLCIVDYIALMRDSKVSKSDNTLYIKGKNIAEGLRSIGQKMDLAMLTATQISKDKIDANDMGLSDMPESKAIAETADTVFAIIRNPIMKVEGKYHVKPLKLRDAEFSFDRMEVDLNKEYLFIHNDKIHQEK